jgi:hypothetical protein
MDEQVFEGVQNFRYLGAFMNSKYLISDEIKQEFLQVIKFLSSKTNI